MTDQNKFESGKVFKLLDKTMAECYFVRTCATLDERMKMIAKECNTMKKSNKPMPDLHKFIDRHGLDNIMPVLVEEYPCVSDVELRQRQTYHMLHNVPRSNKTTPVKVRDPRKTDDEIKKEEREARYTYYLKHTQDEVLCSCGHQYNRARRDKRLITEEHLDHIIDLLNEPVKTYPRSV